YSGINSLTLNGSRFDSVYNVQSTRAGTPLTINTGGGLRELAAKNTVNVTRTDSNGVKTLQDDVHVNGPTGVTNGSNTSLFVFDNDTPTEQYTIAKGRITIKDPVTINYSNVQSVTLDGAASGDYHIEGAPQGTAVTINLGAGANTFHVTPGAQGSVTLQGG